MSNISLTTRRPTSAPVSGGSSCEVTAVRRADTEWTILPELVGEFFDENDLRLADWLRAGEASVVKDGVHRTVYRLDLPSGSYFLKHYRTPRVRNLLQNLVRPCRAELERDASLRVAEQGIPTYETVAVGRRRIGPMIADSYLVTRAIELSVPLDELVQEQNDRSPRPLAPALRRALAVTLGRLVARLHAGGLVHRDMHAGNVLVRFGASGEVRLWLIDPAPLRRRSNMGLRAIEANLALLNNSLAALTSSADRRRFFRAYWEAARSFPPGRFPAELASAAGPPKSVVKRVEDRCFRALLACHRRNDRKWVTGNRRLIIADAPDRDCRAVAGIGRDRVTAIRDDPESLFDENRIVEWLDRSGSRKVAAVDFVIDGKPTTCRAVMMEENAMSRSRSGRSRARRIWEGGHALLRRALSCSTPLLFVEITEGAGAGRQYVLFEDLPECVPLGDEISRCTEREGLGARGGAIDAYIPLLASRIRSMHETGIDHETLTADSVLIHRQGSRCEIAFGELESIRIRRSVSRRRVAAALARLECSLDSRGLLRHRHRVRFLRGYLRSRRHVEWKGFWREIAAARRHLPPGTETARIGSIGPAGPGVRS